MEKRVVITGIGVIAPNGIGKDNFWKALVSGESGIKKISRFDASDYPVKIAGEVNDFNPLLFIEKKRAKHLSRFAQFILAATQMAVDDSGLDLQNEDPYSIGIAFGTTVGGKEIDEQQQRIFREKGWRRVNPFSPILISNNCAVGVVATEFGIKGPNITTSTGCTSALNAIAYAYDLVVNNKANIVIAGGGEAPLVPFVFDAFCVSGVLSKRNGKPERVSRPFEKNRDGYVLSEGCGIVIIEDLNHAVDRKTKIYAEIAGYGVTNDAYSLLKMEPTGEGVARTIQEALKSAGEETGNIDYINAHGSSSLVSDKRETNAIKMALREHAYRVQISSIKSMLGQPLGATGGIQVVSTALAITNGWIPPTINYEEEDPDCDLDYIPNRARKQKINTALINSFGLGGNNVSMIIRRYENGENNIGKAEQNLAVNY